MPQELKGLFTVLCPACRERAPIFVGHQFEWRCSHRKATVRETKTRRILSLNKDSVALAHRDDLK